MRDTSLHARNPRLQRRAMKCPVSWIGAQNDRDLRSALRERDRLRNREEFHDVLQAVVAARLQALLDLVDGGLEFG